MTAPNLAPEERMAWPGEDAPQTGADAPQTGAPSEGEAPPPLLRRALGMLQPSRADLARTLGVSVPALHSYKHGTRKPSRTTRRLVAVYLRAHAAALLALADEMEEELDRRG